MAGRRRKWLLAAALLAIVAALAWWISSSRPTPMLKLIFVGYTNIHPAFFTARVLATNTSGVPLKIRELLYGKNVVETNGRSFLLTGFAAVWQNSPDLIEPGEAIILDVGLIKLGEPWWTEIEAQPVPRMPWLRKVATKLGNRTVLRCVDRLYPPSKPMSFKLGPITNSPPDVKSVLDSRRPRHPRYSSPTLFNGGTYR